MIPKLQTTQTAFVCSTSETHHYAPCQEISELPDGVLHLILTFHKALCAIERLGSNPTAYPHLKEMIECYNDLSPLILRHYSRVTYDVAVTDDELTDEAWEWLLRLKLRGLAVQEAGLSRLPASLQVPNCPLRSLESLAIETSEDEHLSNALPHLTSLKRLEVTLVGAGTSFPRLGDRRLESITVNCSNTASLYSLLSLCQADEVTVTAVGDVVWNTSVQHGLKGFPQASALLEVANGRYNGGSEFSNLRLLTPSGFHRMFGSMTLGHAITSSGTLNCYALGVAAQVAELPPTKLTLQAKQNIRLQDQAGPLPASSLNFSPTLPRSADVWQALWEAAAQYSGMELQYEFQTLGGAEEQGPAGEGEGERGCIRATIHKLSPPMQWPKEEVVTAAGAAAGELEGRAEGGGRQEEGGKKGEEEWRGRRAMRGGKVVWLKKVAVTAMALTTLGLLLKQRAGGVRKRGV